MSTQGVTQIMKFVDIMKKMSEIDQLLYPEGLGCMCLSRTSVRCLVVSLYLCLSVSLALWLLSICFSVPGGPYLRLSCFVLQMQI